MTRDIRTAPHYCAMDHEPIRHWDSEGEECPLCEALAICRDAVEAVAFGSPRPGYDDELRARLAALAARKEGEG